MLHKTSHYDTNNNAEILRTQDEEQQTHEHDKYPALYCRSL